MAEKSLKKFAEELKGLREKKAISLNEIHDKTRIDAKYLSEMEDGNFDVLQEVYVRAFLKKYAEMIDLDGDEILSKYEIAKGENSEFVPEKNSKKIELDEVPKTFDDFESDDSNTAEIDNDDKKRNIFISVAFIFAVSVAAILYFIFFNNSEEEIIIEKPISEIISERTQEESSPPIKIIEKKPEYVVPKTTAGDSLSLRIDAIDTAWMRIMIDNKFDDEFTLNPKLSKVLKAKSSINILVGNAGGIELVLNGNKLPKIGRKGEIKNINVDSQGVHYMKIKKP